MRVDTLRPEWKLLNCTAVCDGSDLQHGVQRDLQIGQLIRNLRLGNVFKVGQQAAADGLMAHYKHIFLRIRQLGKLATQFGLGLD